MKYIIEKQYDKCGDDYNQQREIEVEIYYTDAKTVVFKAYGVMYILPEEIFRGLKFE